MGSDTIINLHELLWQVGNNQLHGDDFSCGTVMQEHKTNEQQFVLV